MTLKDCNAFWLFVLKMVFTVSVLFAKWFYKMVNTEVICK